MENKLSVRDLTISFRTTNGKVQAVRGISFDLAKGETLSIVGESGSGKSVTSKAILGILAGNSIIERGEIIYDGKDLLRISEDEFHDIRGDKIAMIFQDPMSSLNPIVKIGRQLTEAMILKGKARQKESRATFNRTIKLLNENMIAAIAGKDSEKAQELTDKCKKFDEFERRHIVLEAAYNMAHDAAAEAVDDIDEMIFEMDKNAAKDAPFRVKEIVKLANQSLNDYVVKDKAPQLTSAAKQLSAISGSLKKPGVDFSEAIKLQKELRSILDEAVSFEKPNFFAMGYYLTFAKDSLPDMPIGELNKFLRKYLDDEFMYSFISDAKKGIEFSAEHAYRGKEAAVKALREKLPLFSCDVSGENTLSPDKSYSAVKELIPVVESAIDRLEIVKDSLAYTFASGIMHELDTYFTSISKNKAAEATHNHMQAKYDRLVAAGKNPDWKVPAAQVTDLATVEGNIVRQCSRLIEHFEESLAKRKTRDFDAETVRLIDFLKENASGTVNKVTQRIAKLKAIKLMEEVGIAEPRKRYNQYPFEFSGGMRQRIVIAIALAANPDILICDEPTTALDVTIQSQILELINKLKRERQLSVIFITHDLGVVANMADRIAVMYAGKIVEYGTAEDVFYHAAHPYTWALLSSMPDLDTNEKLEAIPGTPPNMIYPPVGDAFAQRNKYAMKIDFERQPPMFKISDTHYAATWLLHPDAPKLAPPKIVTDRIERMKAKRSAEDAK